MPASTSIRKQKPRPVARSSLAKPSKRVSPGVLEALGITPHQLRRIGLIKKEKPAVKPKRIARIARHVR